MKKKYLPPLSIYGNNRPEKIKNLINGYETIRTISSTNINTTKNLKDVI